MKTCKKVSGFTLVEVIVVIAIIGILASFALPAYKQYVQKAEMAEVMALGASLEKKHVAFYSVNRRWGGNNTADRLAILGTTDLTSFSNGKNITRASSHDYGGTNGQIFVEVTADSIDLTGGPRWLRLSLIDNGGVISQSWCVSDGGGGPDTPEEAKPYLGC